MGAERKQMRRMSAELKIDDQSTSRRADLKRARAAFVLGLMLNQGGCCRLVHSSVIQQVWCILGCFFFCQKYFGLELSGALFCNSNGVKAATVQWLRSASKLGRFKPFTPD